MMVNRYMLLPYMAQARATHMIHRIAGVRSTYKTGMHNGKIFSTAKFVELDDLIAAYKRMVSGDGVHPTTHARNLANWKTILKDLLRAKKGIEKDINYIKSKKFEFFAVKSERGLNNFYKEIHPATLSLIGHKKEDFVKVSAKIINKVDISLDPKKYNGVFCGYYDFEKQELSGSYIYNSLLSTQVCFPYAPDSYHGKQGYFVELDIAEL